MSYLPSYSLTAEDAAIVERVGLGHAFSRLPERLRDVTELDREILFRFSHIRPQVGEDGDDTAFFHWATTANL